MTQFRFVLQWRSGDSMPGRCALAARWRIGQSPGSDFQAQASKMWSECADHRRVLKRTSLQQDALYVVGIITAVLAI
jgi:hypothetical protein